MVDGGYDMVAYNYFSNKKLSLSLLDGPWVLVPTAKAQFR